MCRRLEPNDAWALTYRVLWLLGQVLGLQSLRGAHCHTLVYWRDHPQYYTAIILEGGDPMQHYYDANNAEGGNGRRQLSSLIRNISPPLGVSVTVALMPGGSGPTYSGRKRRSRIDRASTFSTWLMAPPMQERFPPPKGR
jgi:hypothetical protein